ncbi:hypothetical protein B296_00016936 [Ensete ventricosum]|uniref:Uncharacterized protein n=1 Tax=Ensete ventricosum TaxID=4639 RepID=A0A426YSC4_ENSVE|nr:hypothetical protein B296_00016936 [Ensete ventricosum]
MVGRLKGILSSSRVIKEMTELWLVGAGLSPASSGTIILLYFNLSSCLLTFGKDANRMDLGELRGMPKVTSGKVPPTRLTAREVVRRHKKVKVLTRRHKSRLGEGESRSRSKGKEPAALSEEPEMPAGFEEGGASPAHRRPRSMKDLFKTKVHKDDASYYTLLMFDLGYQDPEKEMKPIWKGLKYSTKVWNNSSAAEEFERALLHPQLARELYTLPSEVLMARAAKEIVLLLFRAEPTLPADALRPNGGPKVVAKAEGRVSEVQEELKKTRRERDEALRRHEASKKELHEIQSTEAHRLLKEARVRARKMDDELLQAVKALESA